jgi:multidrug resistance efflux pump
MRKIFLTILMLVSVTYAQNIYATFDVLADKSANLAFTASGIVQKVDVDIGTLVKENQILSTLDNGDIKAMLKRTKIVLKFA